MNANPSARLDAVAGRFRLASPRVALLLGALGLGCLMGAVPLAAFAHQLGVGGLVFFLIMLPFGVVGFVLARRVPGNPIGWILLVLAVTLMFTTDVGFYAVRAYRLGHPGLPLARLSVILSAGWLWMLVLMPLPIALFPDGRITSPRWRWTIPAYLVLCASFVAAISWRQVTGIFAKHIQVDSSGNLVTQSSGSLNTATSVMFALYVCFCLSWVIRQVLTWRAATGALREQLKWLLSGGAVCIAGLALGVWLSGSHSPIVLAVSHAGFISLTALPISIGIGILKYRLYDIDRLISRTLSYALLTGLLVGVFVGIVALATQVLPFSSPVAVAASTLAAAALFNPLRKRVQHLVDRRFNRARYDAEAIVAAFTLRLRDAVDLDTVRGELLLAVDRAVEPAHASVWIRPPERPARATH